jgi:hypothetical protein
MKNNQLNTKISINRLLTEVKISFVSCISLKFKQKRIDSLYLYFKPINKNYQNDQPLTKSRFMPIIFI